MNTSQELTRSLRGKGGSLDDKLALCTRLVHGELEVYLPRKESFVLELVCDRLNDNKKEHTSWKLHETTWSILEYLVETCPDVSSRCLKKLRYVEIASAIIDLKSQLITKTIPVAKFLLKNSIMATDANSTQNLLAQCLVLINKNQLDAGVLPTIIAIYEQPRKSTKYKPAKKTSTHFFEACLHPLASYLSDSRHGTETDYHLQQIFIAGLFSKDSASLLKENIKLFLDSNNNLSGLSQSINYIFDNVVSRSAKDMKVSEEIFVEITGKYPHLTQSLLETLASTNRVLSSDFYETLYTQHKDSHQLVGCLIDLEASLGVKHAAEIASKLNDSEASIAGKLFRAFVRVREYTAFFVDIWQANSNKKVWNTLQLVDDIASGIFGLTIKTLHEVLAELSKVPIPPKSILLSILKGLLLCDDDRIKSLKDQILAAGFASHPDWQIRFYCLLLYGDDISIDSETNFAEIYFFYARFRLVELQKSTNAFSAEFVTHLKNLSKAEQKRELSFVFKRWPKIVARFGPDHINTLMSLFLDSEPVAYFETGADFFYEENSLNRLLIACLVTRLVASQSSILRITSSIPTACFERHERRKIIALLLSSSSHESEFLPVMLHLLDKPTFATELETNVRTLISFVKRFHAKPYEDLAVTIFDKIWEAHLAQINDDQHLKFVEEVVGVLKQPRTDSSCLSVFKCIFGRNSLHYNDKVRPLLEELHSNFVDETIANLKKGPTGTLLQILKDVSGFRKGIISIADVRSISWKVTTIKDKRNLFCLLCAIDHKCVEQAVHVLAVYVALAPLTSELDHQLQLYCDSLATCPEDFAAIVSYVLYSFHIDTEDENRYIYLRVYSCLLACADTETDLIHPLVCQLSYHTNELLVSEQNLVYALGMLAQHVGRFKIGQYTFESVVALVTRIACALPSIKTEQAEVLYKHLIQNASELLLSHRMRMSSRHHIVMKLFCALFEPLLLSGNRQLILSLDSAQLYTRAVSCLCEPKFKAHKTASHSLNSAVATAKKSLRRHLLVILLCFIHHCLGSRFEEKVQQELTYAMSIVFDTVSETELQVVVASLDAPGKLYFKLLYSRYKESYKWKS